jgi:hypothetical protein
MDSYTMRIVIRTRIEEQQQAAAQERLLRAAGASTATEPTWRERLALVTRRPMRVANAK